MSTIVQQVEAYEKTKLGRPVLAANRFAETLRAAFSSHDPVAAADALAVLSVAHTIVVQRFYTNPRVRRHRELIEAQVSLWFGSPHQSPSVSTRVSRYVADGSLPEPGTHPRYREFHLNGQGPSCDEFNVLHDEAVWQTLSRWHLASVHDGPMHYRANSMYWWECHHVAKRQWATLAEKRIHTVNNVPDVDAFTIEAFKTNCVFGAVVSDADFSFEKHWLDPDFPMEQWLTDRKPALMRQFYADLVTQHLITLDALLAVPL